MHATNWCRQFAAMRLDRWLDLSPNHAAGFPAASWSTYYAAHALSGSDGAASIGQRGTCRNGNAARRR